MKVSSTVSLDRVISPGTFAATFVGPLLFQSLCKMAIYAGKIGSLRCVIRCCNVLSVRWLACARTRRNIYFHRRDPHGERTQRVTTCSVLQLQFTWSTRKSALRCICAWRSIILLQAATRCLVSPFLFVLPSNLVFSVVWQNFLTNQLFKSNTHQLHILESRERRWYYKYYCFWFTPFLQSILRIPNSYFVRKNNSNQLIVVLTIWIAYQGLYIVTKCFNLALCVSLWLFTTFQLKTSRIFLSFSISLLNGIRSISISQNVQCFIKLHRNSWNFSGIAVGLAQSRTIMQISATFVSPNRANYFLRGLKKANRLNRRNSEDWKTPGRNSFPRNTGEECAHDRNYVHPSKTRSLHR